VKHEEFAPRLMLSQGNDEELHAWQHRGFLSVFVRVTTSEIMKAC
jgi:hypothetical protein